MVLLLCIFLLFLWLGGFAIHLGGDFIHLLLALAVLVFLYEIFVGRNNRVP